MEIKFKENGKIKAELFSTIAENLAEEINKESNGKKNKITQLRKFYDEVLKFNSIIKSAKTEKQEEEFKNLLPYLKMLNAKAKYAEGRELVTENFTSFINSSLNQINTKEDFEIFVNFFEAFMGFYKYYDKKGERDQRDQNRRRI